MGCARASPAAARRCGVRRCARRGVQARAAAQERAALAARKGASDLGAAAAVRRYLVPVRDASVSQRVSWALNAGVVLLVAAGGAYALLEVDLPVGAAKHWGVLQYAAHLPQDNLRLYTQACVEHPLKTKALTSAVAYLLGDFTAQTFQGRTLQTLDLRRTARSGIAGLLIHGPLCHLWIEWMQVHLDFGGAWWNTLVKVAADQTGWSLFLNTAYTTCIMGLQGMRPRQIAGEVNDTWLKALTTGWRFWPFVHLLSFSSLIPTELKLLFIDCVEVVWVTILSATVNKDAEKLACSIEANGTPEMLIATADECGDACDADFTATELDRAA